MARRGTFIDAATTGASNAHGAFEQLFLRDGLRTRLPQLNDTRRGPFFAGVGVGVCTVGAILLWRAGPRALLRAVVGGILSGARLVPGVGGLLEGAEAGAMRELEDELAPRSADPSTVLREIPRDGVDGDAVLQAITSSLQADLAGSGFESGATFAGIYHHPQSALTVLQSRVADVCLNTNALYPGVFKSCRRYEAEAVAMVVSMLKGRLGLAAAPEAADPAPDACGIMTTGGTESVLMAVKACRDAAFAAAGGAFPGAEIVACRTCHPALDKAAHYFGLTLIKLEADPTTQALRPADVAAALSPRTILVYASAPSFPHGVVDPVEALAALTAPRGIWLHVDNCLGGVLLSYARAQQQQQRQQQQRAAAAAVASAVPATSASTWTPVWSAEHNAFYYLQAGTGHTEWTLPEGALLTAPGGSSSPPTAGAGASTDEAAAAVAAAASLDPSAGVWKPVWSAEHSAFYYLQAATGRVEWTLPEEGRPPPPSGPRASPLADIPAFDFTVPGVTSISCDLHKYGFAPKGASVCAFRSPSLRRHAYTVVPDWPAGLYATPTMTGSRSGAPAASAWATLRHLGGAGYAAMAAQVQALTAATAAALARNQHLRLVGAPAACVLAFAPAAGEAFSAYALAARLAAAGFPVTSMQAPAALHVCISERWQAAAWLAALEHCVAAAVAAPTDPAFEGKGEAGIYGAAAVLPPAEIGRILARYCDLLYLVR